MTTSDAQGKCREVDENMSDVIDGVAEDSLFDHMATCERCRDARYDAEQVIVRLRDAAADYRFPEELAETLLHRLDAGGEARTSILPALAREKLSAVRELLSPSRHPPSPPASPPPSSSRAEPAPSRPSPSSRPSSSRGAASPVAPSRSSHLPASRPARLHGSADSALPSARWAWLSLATALVLGLVWLGSGRPPQSTPPARQTGLADAWQGSVVQVERAFGSPIGLSECARGTQVCRPIGADDLVHPGMRLETDGLTRALVRLVDGSTIALDRQSQFELDPSERRRGRLLDGNVVVEIERQRTTPGAKQKQHETDQVRRDDAPAEASHAIIDLPMGRAEVLGTKLSLRADEGSARVEVSRGSVKLFDAREQSVLVQPGEAAVIGAGRTPRVEAVLDLAQAFGWSTSAFEERGARAQEGALGELIAKRPRDGQELGGAVRLTQHHIKARIVDNIARTEVEEVFENQADEVLEGIYRFPLPPGAQIERLALEVDGKLVEGAFVDRERAAAIWRGAVVNAGGKKPPPGDDIVWVPGPWRDPALLEWQRGNRFELRIFPIPARGSRRVVLAYTEVLPPSEGERLYVYPLPRDPRGSTRIGRFTAEIQVRGLDLARGVEARGYPMTSLSGSPEVARLALDQNDFVPSGDLSVAFELAKAELRVWAYLPTLAQPQAPSALPRRGVALDRPVGTIPGGRLDPSAPWSLAADGDAGLPSDAPYVAMALAPQLPRRARHEARDYVLVADASRSMVGESYRRAQSVITRIIREMDRSDRVTVLACDATCLELPGGPLKPGDASADTAARFLAGIEPEGASDLAFAIEQAAALHGARDASGAERSLRVIYVGDGTPTVGPIHPALLERAISEALPIGATLSAIAIGSDADRATLRSVTRAGGGVNVAFSPGLSAEDVAYAVLGASYGHSLTRARLELPAGLVRAAPETLGSIAAGGEELVVMRMTRPEVEGDVVLRGEVAGEAFERRYPVQIAARPGEANAFVPRLYAAVTIAELESSMDEGARRRSIELSTRFNVTSRYTSLLVLESPAMFTAFGLDNRRSAPAWTGELESDKAESDGETEELAWVGSLETESDGAESNARSSRGGPSPAASMAPSRGSDAQVGGAAPPTPELRQPFEVPARRMIPMRRVWDRVARIDAPPSPLLAASHERRQSLELEARENAESRDALRRLYVVDLLSGDLASALRAVEHWSAKDPLDVDALTARADLAAQRGQRDLAIRILAGVVDVRPGDYKAQWRLARLHRWAGRPERGCRHSLAVAQLVLRDAKLVSEAVGCARDVGQHRTADALLASLDPEVRGDVERRVLARRDSDQLSGDFRVTASWQGSEHDLDVVVLAPEGYRISWLGAPTRAVITAKDVLSLERESLALRGAPPGEYAVELVRSSSPPGPVRGTLRIQIADAERNLPFTLENERLRVATANLRNQARLIPLESFQ